MAIVDRISLVPLKKLLCLVMNLPDCDQWEEQLKTADPHFLHYPDVETACFSKTALNAARLHDIASQKTV
jgi:hypothetical protein